jgi:cytochrome b pre-mRNA-processing protein 3
MILPLFRKNRPPQGVGALYDRVVKQARAAPLYVELGAPDTLEGRFELLTLHVYLILRRLKNAGPDAKTAGQRLFDVMFQNLDDMLREQGVGDLAVPRRIRKLAENFYGRVGAYEKALAHDAPRDALACALARNVYADPDPETAAALADYVRRAAAAIEDQSVEAIIEGRIRFPKPAFAR